MQKRNLRQEKGITLIALVITIIVMLILVAVTVSIAVNGGLFNYAKNAGRETRFAVLEEQLYSAYMEDIMADYANGTDNASFANAIAKLNLNGEYVIEPITSSGVADIVLNPDITTNAIVIGTDDETKTATFTATPEDEDETTNYYVVEDEEYYKINYNGNGLVKIDTNPSDVNTNNNTLSIIVADETIATGSITGNTVTITGAKKAGSTTFKVKCGSVEKTGTINAIAPVAITFDLNGGNISGSTDDVVRSGLPGANVNIPTAPTMDGYIFKGWYDAEENGNLVYATTATTAEVPNSAITYYAQWKEPKTAFRTYGNPVATNSTSGTYGTLGTRVYLGQNSTNPAAITVGGTYTIEDNWYVFYEDTDFIYLIYGDYYPVNVQTNSDFSTIGFGGNKTYGVKDSKNRPNLLKYLRNNSAYTWTSSNNSYGTNGTTYTSWNDLKTALNATAELTGKTIAIQASPDIELWVKSWNAKGNTELKTSKTSNGYQIGLSSGTTANDISLSSYTGYNDTLYFPYKNYQTTAYGYWLASPGASGSYIVCIVRYHGRVSGYGCNDADYCVRPVVSIEK